MKEWFRRHHPSFRQTGDVNRDIPEDLWVKCPACSELIYNRELENNSKVCMKCSHHFRLRAAERVVQLTDHDCFEECHSDLISADPLNFVSVGEHYYDKMQQSRERTGMSDAVVIGYASIQGCPTVLAVVDFSFQGGSMGSVYGEKLVRAVDMALDRRRQSSPYQRPAAHECRKVCSLMQMAKTTTAFARLPRPAATCQC
ncbi:MAG: carboxyl transferase domain-containing protein [Chloroflexia bacterium]